jgi:phosphohistidine phosphatase
MELYILRHAIAVQRGTAGYDQDSERPLTPKGAKKIRSIAKGMRALGIDFDLILSSPFLRAKETADIVANTFKSQKKLRFSGTLAVGGKPAELIDELNDKHNSLESVMLVGHEPYLSELISVLISGDSRVKMTMKKGGLCKLNAASLHFGHCATLEWLIAPRHLTRFR